MAMKTYQGSCHCKKVRFELDFDFAAAGTKKCNCTSCWKKRWWGAYTVPSALRALAGAEVLSRGEDGGFCRECGVITYNRFDSSSWGGIGPEVSINVASLDDLEPGELVSGPIQYQDGRHDNWWNAPAETRHM